MTGTAISGVSEVLGRWLAASGRQLLLRDRASGQILPVSTETAVAADGLLPVFLAAGEAVWRDAVGSGFGLRIEQENSALLGFRASGLGNVPRSVVLLATVEAVEQAAKPGALLVNDLNAVLRAAYPLPRAGQTPGPTP